MKLLRVGTAGNEKPALLHEGKIKNLEGHILDLDPTTINFNTLDKLKKIDMSKLPDLDSDQRIGPCIKNPGKFIAIGLNYSDHAEESGMAIPKEPIIFHKATSSIVGPNDNIVMPKDSKNLIGKWRLDLLLVKKQKILQSKKPRITYWDIVL